MKDVVRLLLRRGRAQEHQHQQKRYGFIGESV
jgi:hypothetical protein